MRRTSPQLGPREYLELFVTRVNELKQTTIIKNNGLVNEWSLSFSEGQDVVVQSVQPDEDLLRSYLMTFRKFISPDEPVFIRRIHTLCHQHLTSDELKDHIRVCQQGWKSMLVHTGIKTQLDGREVTPEYIANLWINGHYFHDDPKKAEELKRYIPSIAFVVRRMFLDFIVEASRVIFFTGHGIEVALRDGLVKF